MLIANEKIKTEKLAQQLKLESVLDKPRKKVNITERVNAITQGD